MKELDARSLACPGPVIELRKLLESGEREIRILVADDLSRSNVERFAVSRQASVSGSPAPGGGFALEVRAPDTAADPAPNGDPEPSCELPAADPEPRALVVQVTSSSMGSGDEELGAILMRSFLKTQVQLPRLPDSVIFYNTGVRLCCEGSPLIDDLTALSAAGVEILACGTCLNFFDLASKLRVGRVTDMLEIATRLSAADRLIRP
jgi:selenium metabolism protein YedF